MIRQGSLNGHCTMTNDDELRVIKSIYCVVVIYFFFKVALLDYKELEMIGQGGLNGNCTMTNEDESG